MSRNYKLFLGAAFLFWIAGLMNEAPALYIMAGVSLASVLGCYVISRLAVAGLDLEVAAGSDRVWADSDVPVDIRLTNVGVISRPAAPVQVTVKNATLDIEEGTHLFALPALTPSQSVSGEVEVPIRYRGRHVLEDPRLVGRDPLGMFHRPGPPTKSVSFLALPRPLHIPPQDILAMLSERTRLEMANRRQRAGEFFGIRLYQPGDELRDVHWKATAHTGDIVVKEYAGGSEYRSAVWLDTSEQSLIGSGPESSFETGVIAAASVLKGLSEIGINTTLFAEGLSDSLRSPEAGASIVRRALQELATVRPVGKHSFADNTQSYRKHTGSGMTVFAITTGSDDSAVEALMETAAAGVAMRVILAGCRFAGEEIEACQAGVCSYLRAHDIPTVVACDAAQLQAAFARLASSRTSAAGAGVSR